jgi:hypothetical protein
MPSSSAVSKCGSRGTPSAMFGCFHRIEVRNDPAHEAERVSVVHRVMIRDAGEPRVHVGAAEVFGRHHLAGRGLHQRRAG